MKKYRLLKDIPGWSAGTICNFNVRKKMVLMPESFPEIYFNPNSFPEWFEEIKCDCYRFEDRACDLCQEEPIDHFNSETSDCKTEKNNCDPGFYQCAHGVSVALPCLQCKEGLENAVIQKEPSVEACKHKSIVAWCSACSSIVHNFIPDKPLFAIKFEQPNKSRINYITLGISKKSIGDSIMIGDRVIIKILDFIDERFFIEISMQDHLTYSQNNGNNS